MKIAEFTVFGVAAPQGSKVRTKFGGIREANPRTMPWRQEVAARALEAMGGKEPALGPLRLTVWFHLPRPKSHYRTGKHAGELKADAPLWVTTKPDRTKLLRATEDALTGIVWRDDAQVVCGDAWKRYVVVDAPRAVILVETVEEP